MCRFTSRQPPVSQQREESPKEKFVKAEKILSQICDQMSLVLLKTDDVCVRLRRAEDLSAAEASLEMQQQVLQGVYTQMYELAAQKAEEMEKLYQFI